MPTPDGEIFEVIDDRGLSALFNNSGCQINLSMEGYPRILCRLPAAWDTGDQKLIVHLLYVVFSGNIVISTQNGELVVEGGDVVLLPPAVAFRARSKSGAVRLARLRFLLCRSGMMLSWGSGPRVWRSVAGIQPVVSLAEDLLLRRIQDPASDRALFILLHGALKRAGEGGPLTPAQITRLRQRVAADPACTPSHLARELGLSHDYATRLIRRSLGEPPRAFILGERLRIVADRLGTGSAPSKVAADLGWSDHKLFLRQFRAAYGLPPGRWLRHLA